MLFDQQLDPRKNDVFALLPEDAVQKAMEAVTEHATVYWPEPTVCTGFRNPEPADKRRMESASPDNRSN